MKKFLYALTTGLLLATGLTAQAESGVVVSSTGASTTNKAPIAGWDDGFMMAQTLYTATEMSEATSNISDYKIQGLTYTLSSTQDMQGSLEIYLTAVDGSMTSLTTAIPEDQWTKVWSGSVTNNNVVNDLLSFELDTPFAMEKGKALVITTKYTMKIKGYWYFKAGNPENYGDDIRTRWYETYSEDNLSADRLNDWYKNHVPSLTITYGQGEVSDSFKVGVEIEGTPETNVGTDNAYKVRLTNKAAQTLSDYKVALLVNNEQVATIDGPAITSGASDAVTLNYTYPAKGDYIVGAKVWKENILPANSNNMTVSVAPYVPANISNLTLPAGTGYDSDWRSQDFIDRTSVYSASECLFPASWFNDFTSDIDIYTMAFHVQQDQLSSSCPVELEIYMAQTARTESFTEDPTFVPEEAFTKVWSGIFDPAMNAEGERTKCNFTLDEPFTLEKGKSLVMNVYMRDPADAANRPKFSVVIVNTEEAYMRAGSCGWVPGQEPSKVWMTPYANNSRATFSNYKYLPQIDFGYQAAKAPEKIDLAIETGSDWPTEGEADKVTRFPLTVTNVGTVDVEEFTVELLDYSSGDMDNPKVLHKQEVNDLIVPGSSSNYRLRYNFEKGGMYYIGARVVVNGDENLENNYIEPEVFEIPLPALDLQITGFSGEEEVMAGEETEYEVTVTNGGSEPLMGKFNVEIIDGDNNVLTSAEASLSLAVGGTGYIGMPVTFEEAGFYEIRARINVEGDADPSNNVSEALEVVAYPNGMAHDLEIADFVCNDDIENIVDSTEVEFEVAIFNAGLEPASGFVITIENVDADQTLASATINLAIPAQKIGYYAIPVVFPKPGIYSIAAHVGYVNDENEDNDWSDVLNINVSKNLVGVADIEADIEAGNVYNVQGFRINKTENLPAGIYIVNGKKMVLK